MNAIFPYPIRIAVLDYPVKYWSDPRVQSMYCKITDLKLRGYWGSHGHENVIPVDVSDLIGANVATCYETPQGLIPIMAFRMLSLKRCDLHRNRFPALSVLESSGQNTACLESILNSVRSRSRDIVYASSWTRTENLPESFASKRFLRMLHTANIINFMNSRQIDEFVACSALKYRVNRHFDYCGMRRISEAFKQHSVFDIEAVMYHLGDRSQFSASAMIDCEAVLDYWRNRLEIGSSDISATKVAA